MKLLLYCCKAKPYLYKGISTGNIKYYKMNEKTIFTEKDKFNGKIVAECDFEVETIHCETHYEPEVNIGVGILPEFTCNQYSTETLGHFKLLEKSCLKDLTLPYEEHRNELDDYLQGKDGYAIHIKNLHIFDRPKELKDYDSSSHTPIKHAPQNMMEVFSFIKGKKMIQRFNKEVECWWSESNILISIRPEWLCKILNGEKTIEIRKKVLKGMIK